MNLEEIKALLIKNHFSIVQEERSQSCHATVLKLRSGEIVNCWDNGNVSVQGENSDRNLQIWKLLSGLQGEQTDDHANKNVSGEALLPFPVEKVQKEFSFQREKSVSKFVDQLNSYIIDFPQYEKLEHKQITDALRRNNILEDSATDRSTVFYLVPTEKGASMGFNRRKMVYRSGSSIDYASYNKQAQEFVVQHLGELLNGDVIGTKYDMPYPSVDTRRQEALDEYNRVCEWAQKLDDAEYLFQTYVVSGTRVIHKTFGPGTILSSDDAGHVEISFEKVGNKKMDVKYLLVNNLIQMEDQDIENSIEDLLPYLAKEKEIHEQLEETRNLLEQFSR